MGRTLVRGQRPVCPLLSRVLGEPDQGVCADEGVRPASDSACKRIAYRANNSGGKGDGSPERITGAQCKKLAVPVFLINCSWA